MAHGEGAARAVHERRWAYWLALLALALPVQMTVTASPFLNALSMQLRDLNESQIGNIRTAEILTNATLSVLLSVQITKFAPRHIGFFGLALFTLGNALCTLPGGFWELLGTRILAGGGAGCMGGALAALVVQAPRPHRVVGVLAVPVTCGAIVTALLTGAAAQAGDALGLFGFLALGGGLGLALFARAPGGKFHAAHPPQIGSLLGALRRPYVLGYMTLFAGSTAVYHFLAAIGADRGAPAGAVGQIAAGVAVACGLLAPLAGLVRESWVRPAFLIALVAFGLGSTAIPISPGLGVFIAGFALQSLAFTYIQVLGASVAARLDKTGGLQSAANGWNALGNAFSPAIGGALIYYGGSYAPLAVMCALTSAITITLMVIGTRGARAGAAAAPPPTPPPAPP